MFKWDVLFIGRVIYNDALPRKWIEIKEQLNCCNRFFRIRYAIKSLTHTLVFLKAGKAEKHNKQSANTLFRLLTCLMRVRKKVLFVCLLDNCCSSIVLLFRPE